MDLLIGGIIYLGFTVACLICFINHDLLLHLSINKHQPTFRDCWTNWISGDDGSAVDIQNNDRFAVLSTYALHLCPPPFSYDFSLVMILDGYTKINCNLDPKLANSHSHIKRLP